jgi:hypothetical protein
MAARQQTGHGVFDLGSLADDNVADLIHKRGQTTGEIDIHPCDLAPNKTG